VIDTVEVFLGWTWEARVLERFSQYTVNGEAGWGVSEWQYRHHDGRPKDRQDADPDAVRNAPKY
jgi:hypothetical protein